MKAPARFHVDFVLQQEGIKIICPLCVHQPGVAPRIFKDTAALRNHLKSGKHNEGRTTPSMSDEELKARIIAKQAELAQQATQVGLKDR